MENNQSISLKTGQEIREQYERVLALQFAGTIEPRVATSITTTLKAAAKLQIEYPLKYMSMLLQAKIRKISDIPKLPEGTLPLEVNG